MSPFEEHEGVQEWSTEWQRNIRGVTRKRDSSRSRSQGFEGDEEERRRQAPAHHGHPEAGRANEVGSDV